MSTIPSADISDKKFFSDDERYADLINGLICQGRPVVRKEDLQDLDTQTGIWNDPAIHKSKNRRRVKLRDLVKKASFGVNFLVIGIENQQTIDYSLPLRCMTYEAGEYERQFEMPTSNRILENIFTVFPKRVISILQSSSFSTMASFPGMDPSTFTE